MKIIAESYKGVKCPVMRPEMAFTNWEMILLALPDRRVSEDCGLKSVPSYRSG
jgi:hypothetical protein